MNVMLLCVGGRKYNSASINLILNALHYTTTETANHQPHKLYCLHPGLIEGHLSASASRLEFIHFHYHRQLTESSGSFFFVNITNSSNLILLKHDKFKLTSYYKASMSISTRIVFAIISSNQIEIIGI